jgi:hypothetical protein
MFFNERSEQAKELLAGRSSLAHVKDALPHRLAIFSAQIEVVAHAACDFTQIPIIVFGLNCKHPQSSRWTDAECLPSKSPRDVLLCAGG